MGRRRKSNKKRPPPPPPTRTSGIKKRAMAAKWEVLPIPIIIQIISWLDQESLMDLILVSKQLQDIICNEPGNENQIIPVFEVNPQRRKDYHATTLTFAKKLRDFSLDNDLNNKLQYYRRMVINNADWFDCGTVPAPLRCLEDIVTNVQMSGITSLYYFSSSLQSSSIFTTYILAMILPNLREVDFSNTCLNSVSLRRFTMRCPRLEKITSYYSEKQISLCGTCMSFSNNLKEITMDNSCFSLDFNTNNKDNFFDLSNHQDVYIFHKCCQAIERVSIRNMDYYSHWEYPGDDDEQKEILIQNALIKFVRNAPSTLRWFRSDLTSDNTTMLRLERPGIELLN
jgi:hypothetical protein